MRGEAVITKSKKKKVFFFFLEYELTSERNHLYRHLVHMVYAKQTKQKERLQNRMNLSRAQTHASKKNPKKKK